MNLRQLCLLFAVVPALSYAADPEMTLVLKDHRFTPDEIKVPAGKKIKLMVENQDATAEEFESRALSREKVIPGKAKLPVFIGPLTPGKYTFFGEYHQATAHGVVIVE
jgi:plastocyanin